jgi:hypothetical protein
MEGAPIPKLHHSNFITDVDEMVEFQASAIYKPNVVLKTPAGGYVTLAELLAGGECVLKLSNCSASYRNEKEFYLGDAHHRAVLLGHADAYSDAEDNFMHLLALRRCDKLPIMPDDETPVVLSRLRDVLAALHADGRCVAQLGTYKPCRLGGEYYLSRFERAVNVPPSIGGFDALLKPVQTLYDIVSAEGVFFASAAEFGAGVLQAATVDPRWSEPNAVLTYAVFRDMDLAAFRLTVELALSTLDAGPALDAAREALVRLLSPAL